MIMLRSNVASFFVISGHPSEEGLRNYFCCFLIVVSDQLRVCSDFLSNALSGRPQLSALRIGRYLCSWETAVSIIASIPNSPNKHHEKCMAESRENY